MKHHRPTLVARRMRVVVRRRDEASLRIELAREIAAEPAPLVLPATRDRQPSIPSLSVRCERRGLESDVSLDVSADEVVGGHLPVNGPVEKVLTILRLIHAQASQKSGGSWFVGDRAHRIGAAVLRILEENRTMAAELQIDGARRLTLDGDLLTQDAERLPAVLPFHLIGSSGWTSSTNTSFASMPAKVKPQAIRSL